MKITAEHYAYMRAAISAVAADIPARRAAIVAEGKAKDIEKRLRWDLCYAAIAARWICDVLYVYADDSHIDTALRAIVRELGK